MLFSLPHIHMCVKLIYRSMLWFTVDDAHSVLCNGTPVYSFHRKLTNISWIGHRNLQAQSRKNVNSHTPNHTHTRTNRTIYSLLLHMYIWLINLIFKKEYSSTCKKPKLMVNGTAKYKRDCCYPSNEWDKSTHGTCNPDMYPRGNRTGHIPNEKVWNKGNNGPKKKNC